MAVARVLGIRFKQGYIIVLQAKPFRAYNQRDCSQGGQILIPIRESYHLNTSIDQSEQQHIAPDEAHVTPRMVAVQVGGSGHSNDERVRELAVWLDALRSFFRVPNYPLSNKDQVAIFTRDWTNEVRILCAALAHTTHLTLSIVETEGANNELIEDQDDGTTSGL